MNRIMALAMSGFLAAGMAVAWAQAPTTMPAPSTLPAATEGATTQAATPATLVATINESIALLDAGKDRELIEKLAPPDVVAQAKASGDFDKMVSDFASSPRHSALITALRSTQPTSTSPAPSPNISDNGKLVVFPATSSDMPELQFTLVNGTWHLK